MDVSSILSKIEGAITPYAKDNYIKPFKNFSLENLKNQLKNAADAPKILYTAYKNSGLVPLDKEREYVTTAKYGPVITIKGYTPTELRRRNAISYGLYDNMKDDPKKIDDYITSIEKRDEIIKDHDGEIQTEVQRMLGLAVVKNLKLL